MSTVDFPVDVLDNAPTFLVGGNQALNAGAGGPSKAITGAGGLAIIAAANAAAVRTAAGLGTAATHAAGDFDAVGTTATHAALLGTSAHGLGSASTLAAAAVLQTANNLSELAASAAAARANIGVDARITHAFTTYAAIPVTAKEVATTGAGAACSWTLPAASAVNAGYELLIVDEAGGCSAINILSILAAGTDTINGLATQAIVSAYGTLRFISDGTSKWSLSIGNSGVTLAQLQAQRYEPALTHFFKGGVVGKKIVFVGDSTTMQYQTSQEGAFYNRYIRDATSPLYGAKLRWQWANGARMSEYISGGACDELISRNPDLVVFSYGINDVRLRNSNTVAQDIVRLADYLRAIVNKIKLALPSCDVILRVPNSLLAFDPNYGLPGAQPNMNPASPYANYYVLPSGFNPYTGSHTLPTRAQIATAAQEASDIMKGAYNAVKYEWPDVVTHDTRIDTFPDVAPATPNMMMGDQLHPSGYGYAAVTLGLIDLLNKAATVYDDAQRVAAQTNPLANNDLTFYPSDWKRYPLSLESTDDYDLLVDGFGYVTVNQLGGYIIAFDRRLAEPVPTIRDGDILLQCASHAVILIGASLQDTGGEVVNVYGDSTYFSSPIAQLGGRLRIFRPRFYNLGLAKKVVTLDPTENKAKPEWASAFKISASSASTLDLTSEPGAATNDVFALTGADTLIHPKLSTGIPGGQHYIPYSLPLIGFTLTKLNDTTLRLTRPTISGVTLTGDVTARDTTIPVSDTAPFYAATRNNAQGAGGFVTIGTEQIIFEGVSVSSGAGNLLLCSRGQFGTMPQAALTGAAVTGPDLTAVTTPPNASTTLAAGVSATATTVAVTSAAGFPAKGTVVLGVSDYGAYVGSERISYRSVSGNNLLGCIRGVDDSVAIPHGVKVIMLDPQLTVALTGGETTLTLTSTAGFAASGNVMIDTELIAYSNVVNQTTITCSAVGVAHLAGAAVKRSILKVAMSATAAVPSGTDVITLESTYGFPVPAGAQDYYQVTIGTETVYYTGVSGNTLTGCIRNAIPGSNIGSHAIGVALTAVGFTITGNTLVTNSPYISTLLSDVVDGTDTTIHLTQVAGLPAYGAIQIENEKIRYSAIVGNDLTVSGGVAGRGILSTSAVGHTITSPTSKVVSTTRYVPDRFTSILTASLGGALTDTVISVLDATRFKSDTGVVFVQSEAIYYNGISGDTLTGCVRGVRGTSIAAHALPTNSASTLAAPGIDAAVTTIPVADTTSFYSVVSNPLAANYPGGGTIRIGNEIISYSDRSTTSGAGNLTGCTRARYDTTAATHATSDPVVGLENTVNLTGYDTTVPGAYTPWVVAYGARRPALVALPTPYAATITVSDADYGENLIISGSQILTVNVGLRIGFRCRIKGTIASIAGTATVNDVRTTGATNPWCELLAIGVDTYDLVGTQA